MLQQTRVETVLDYYGAWLERFPDVQTLARAPLDDVLLRWQGLGYYRRARNLHRAAAVVRERYGGHLPDSANGLRALPGVGEYTAGAVASIAFGEAVPAVDGNVRRVLARVFDEAEPTPSWLRKVAGTLVDPERPGDWNQALMDLGATTCTPTSPDCERCPIAAWCTSRARGTQGDRPAPSPARSVPKVEIVTAVVVDGDRRALVVRLPPDGLLGGMWSFPGVELERAESGRESSGLPAVARAAAAREGAEVSEGGARTLEPVRHRFTHLEATYRPVLLRGRGTEGADRRWLPLDGPFDVALPVAQQKIAHAAQSVLTEE